MSNPAAEAARKLRERLTKSPEPPVSTSPLDEFLPPEKRPKRKKPQPEYVPVVDGRGREVGRVSAAGPFGPVERRTPPPEDPDDQLAEGQRALAEGLYGGRT